MKIVLNFIRFVVSLGCSWFVSLYQRGLLACSTIIQSKIKIILILKHNGDGFSSLLSVSILKLDLFFA